MTYWIVAIVLWGLAYLNWIRFRDWLYPAVGQSILWAVVITWLAWEQRNFDPIGSFVTWVVVLGGVVLFALGAWIATLDHEPYMERNYVEAISPVPRSRALFFFFIAAAVLPLFVRTALGIASGGSGLSFLADLREEVGQEGVGFGPYMLIIWVAFASGAALVLEHFSRASQTRRARLLVWASIGVALTYAVLSSGRNSVLFLVLLTLGIPAVLRAITVRTFAIGLVALGLTMFVTFSFLAHSMGLDVQDLGSTNDTQTIVYDMARTYIAGPVVAFDKIASHPPELELGVRVFRDINRVLNLFGAHIQVRPVVEEWVSVPDETNIYTSDLPYFLDFGLVGVFAFQLGAGFLHGYLYRRATVRSPQPLAVLWYAFSLFPLAMQYCTDMYMIPLNRWLIFAVLFSFMYRFRNSTVPRSIQEGVVLSTAN